ncbi:unnamed protein product [Adineta steineri]|uniref:GEVED domain-containing protein n=1 Tax=Adineta steineri TaxID=433720 RepID=A0A814KQC4_9BILA|nr:unnamed protein product [Adineta steineri]CAF4036175.1 unnamed protein product [Adineta steineri]
METETTVLNDHGRTMRVIMREGQSSRRSLLCDNPLPGNILQFNIVSFYSHHCSSQRNITCRKQFLKEIEIMFNQMLTMPATIQFDNDHFKRIDIKICSITEMTEEDEEKLDTTAGMRGRKAKKTLASIVKQRKHVGNHPIDDVDSHIASKKSKCSQSIGKIAHVQITGEHGSHIEDDAQTNDISANNKNRQQLSITFYEDTTYQLHFRFDCSEEHARFPYDNKCDLAQNVNVWIDFNDNDFIDAETLVPHSSWSNSYIRGNSYDLNIHIPIIDNIMTKFGPHRMRLAVIPTENYYKECDPTDFKDTREYTVNILPKAASADIVDRAISDTVNEDSLCSMNTGQIVVVIMAGERGTEIRDDQPTQTLQNDNYNRHHMDVTIYEHTVYLIRIQLDCLSQLDIDLFENGCNLAQDVKVWIDINNDGHFDEAELGALYRWPITSYMAQGIYDLQIYIPLLDRKHITTGRHKMRIVVLHTENYRRICGRSNYNETREYNVNIVSRGEHQDVANVATPHVVLNDIECSVHLGKIIFVIIAGEHQTQIRDDSSANVILNKNNHKQPHHNIILYENTVYQLRIQLDCSRQMRNDLFQYSCSVLYDVNIWIDLNDDGLFDTSENAAPYRWPFSSFTPQGIYDLQLSIPIIDAKKTTSGPHRMQLMVTMNEQYRKKCGDDGYKETREYTVSIIPTTRQKSDISASSLVLSDAVCSQKNPKIALVIMTGEKGTQIRDNIQAHTSLGEHQNRHHLAVTLYENTIYRIRIQLDCFSHWKGGFPESNCNVAQDVDVLIDFNHDEIFDEIESLVPHRWPLLSSMSLGIYDLHIDIPAIEENIKSGPYRMRIVVMPSEEYHKKCGQSDYRETREYTVNIIPKAVDQELVNQFVSEPKIDESTDFKAMYCSPGNVVCSDGNSGISLVKLVGEQGTQINDEYKQCNSMNNYHDRSNLVVTLLEDTPYDFRIKLHCIQQWNNKDSSIQDSSLVETDCNHTQYLGIWIDLDNDGTFDENKERILPGDWDEDDQYTTQYDLSLVIPKIDDNNYLSQQHRMRILLTQDKRNIKPCYSTGYGEVRDYTVQIISKLLQ